MTRRGLCLRLGSSRDERGHYRSVMCGDVQLLSDAKLLLCLGNALQGNAEALVEDIYMMTN